MRKDFEQLPHMADIKLRAYGKTLTELFTNALIGMFQSIRPHAYGCSVQNDRVVCEQLTIFRTVDLSAKSVDLLLVELLSEALYLSDVHNEAYLGVIVDEISHTNIKATLQGVTVDGFDEEIKAVTYHGLKVEQTDGEWVAEVLFDI